MTPLIVTFCDSTYIPVAQNWLKFLSRLNLEPLAKVVSLDDATKDAFPAQALLHRPLPEADTGLDALWLHRLSVLRDLLSQHDCLIHSDADAIWLKSPMSDIERCDADMVFSQETYWPRDVHSRRGLVLCCGFFFLRHAPTALTFLDAVLDRMPADKDDQVAVNRVISDWIGELDIDSPYEIPFPDTCFSASHSPITARGSDRAGRSFSVSVLPHHAYPRLMDDVSDEMVVAHPLFGKTLAEKETILVLRVRRLLPVSPDFIEGVQRATLSSEDIVGRFGPGEGLRAGVVLEEVVVDRVLEIVDAGVAAAADLLCGDLGEEALDEVQPGRAGGREMQFEPRVLLQPRLHLGRFVGGIVVEHDVDVARLQNRAVDPAQESQELLRPVAWHAFPDDEARLHVQRGEERGGAVALVVVGHRGSAPFLERQPGLGPVERLDLGLLIDAEHDRTVRWIEVEADDLGDLLLEHRVVRDLEPLHDMRLQPGIGPDAPHARRRDAHRLGHRRAAPVRGVVRRLLHGLRDHLQPDLPGKRRHTRGSRLVALEPRHAFIEIPLLPTPDRRLRHARPPHDLNGPHAISCRKHDPGPPNELARRVAVGAQSFKLNAVGGAKVKADVRASHLPLMPRASDLGNPTSDGEH